MMTFCRYYNAPEGTSFDEYLATFDSGDSGSGVSEAVLERDQV